MYMNNNENTNTYTRIYDFELTCGGQKYFFYMIFDWHIIDDMYYTWQGGLKWGDLGNVLWFAFYPRFDITVYSVDSTPKELCNIIKWLGSGWLHTIGFSNEKNFETIELTY